MGGGRKKEKPAGRKERISKDMEREKDKIKTARNSKDRRERIKYG